MSNTQFYREKILFRIFIVIGIKFYIDYIIILILSVLPAPTQFLQDLEEDDESSEVLQEQTNTYEVYADKIPPYGSRSGWVPRTVEVKY